MSAMMKTDRDSLGRLERAIARGLVIVVVIAVISIGLAIASLATLVSYC